MHIQPPTLKVQDTIGIVSTARCVEKEPIEKAVRVFESWGLKVKLGEHIFSSAHQFAGSDRQRLSDLQKMIDDETVKAIICSRGGYGTTRIIDEVNFERLKRYPKWIGGFSDITALLCQLHNLGLESIHGIMPGLFIKEGTEEAIESLRRVLFGEPIQIYSASHPFNRTGQAAGPVIGGNLSILSNIVGTPSDIDTNGKILFIEDLDEYLYHVDRMMVHLKRAGKLQSLKGLIVGQMSDMNDNKVPFGKDAYEIIQEHTSAYTYPICFGFPVGHEADNRAIPCSREGKLTVSEEGGSLVF